MGGASSVPIMLSTLHVLFQSSFGDTQVLYGDSSKTAERQNLVLSGDVEWEDEGWLYIGSTQREERYSLDGFLQCRDPGDTAEQALEAAFALTAAVETLLRSLVQPNNQALAQALAAGFPGQSVYVVNIEFKPKAGRAFPADEGVAYQIDFGIAITARI